MDIAAKVMLMPMNSIYKLFNMSENEHFGTWDFQAAWGK